MFMLAGAQCFVNIMMLSKGLDREDAASYSADPVPFPLKYSLSAVILIVALTLVVFARYVSINSIKFVFYVVRGQ